MYLMNYPHSCITIHGLLFLPVILLLSSSSQKYFNRKLLNSTKTFFIMVPGRHLPTQVSNLGDSKISVFKVESRLSCLASHRFAVGIQGLLSVCLFLNHLKGYCLRESCLPTYWPRLWERVGLVPYWSIPIISLYFDKLQKTVVDLLNRKNCHCGVKRRSESA